MIISGYQNNLPGHSHAECANPGTRDARIDGRKCGSLNQKAQSTFRGAGRLRGRGCLDFVTLGPRSRAASSRRPADDNS